MPEPITTAIATAVLAAIASKSTELSVDGLKALFKKEGHEITDSEAEKIVHQIQTQQINNGTMTKADIENYVKNNDFWQQIIHGDNVIYSDNARHIETGGGNYVENQTINNGAPEKK